MAGIEQRECWASRPSVRLWGFLAALVSVVVSAAQLVFVGVNAGRLAGLGLGLVGVVMPIAWPFVFRDGER